MSKKTNGSKLLDDLLNESDDDSLNGSITNDMDDMNNMNDGSGDIGFYELLGISKNAIKKEIKTAYRKKALVMHPDRMQQQLGSNFNENKRKEAENAFHDLVFAYKTLIDDNLRKMYDLYGKTAINDKLNIDITKINLMELFDTLYDENDEKNDKQYPPKLYVIVRYDQYDLKKGIFNLYMFYNNCKLIEL